MNKTEAEERIVSIVSQLDLTELRYSIEMYRTDPLELINECVFDGAAWLTAAYLYIGNVPIEQAVMFMKSAYENRAMIFSTDFIRSLRPEFCNAMAERAQAQAETWNLG